MFHSKKLKYHEQAIPPTTLGTKQAKNDMLTLRFKTFIENSGRNVCWQGPKDWLHWVQEKATKYILPVESKVLFYYSKQYGLLYYNDIKEGLYCSLKVSVSTEIRKNYHQITV